MEDKNKELVELVEQLVESQAQIIEKIEEILEKLDNLNTPGVDYGFEGLD